MFKTPVLESFQSVLSSQCSEWISSGKYTHVGKTEKLLIPGEAIILGIEKEISTYTKMEKSSVPDNTPR